MFSSLIQQQRRLRVYHNAAHVRAVAGGVIYLDARRQIPAVLHALRLDKERIGLQKSHSQGRVTGKQPALQHKALRGIAAEDGIDIGERENIRR